MADNPSSPPRLERRWRWRGEWHIERFRPEEQPFYGSSVAEGICPDLHDEDDLVADGSQDRRARFLKLGADGWLHCEDEGVNGNPVAPWRFVGVGSGR